MSKSFQLSFTILIVFTILVLGVVGNVEQKSQDWCWSVVNKDRCLQKECESLCLKKNPKGKFICAPSTPGGPFQCQCRHPCR
ncbi:S locus-related glycoprotein 1 binding pollen coat protein [Arabidopsis suecica]|uniref:S locus-related glycoprotein 1 binding pollen coat protein n=1 Tax=Arabidopsis suecica TaxID=45249 RepID=A0A8T2BHI2_ARASU|nr:S locus-related glycoprotein 1 binding pollen coat protein [Arabidopsis suecica]